MKYKTTLFLLLTTLVSAQAMAHDNHPRGYYTPDRNDRSHSNHDRYRDRGYRDDRYGRDGRRYADRNYRKGYGRHQYRDRGHSGGVRINYNRLMRYNPDQFARWYADTAMSQIDRARRNGCRVGNSKGRWRYKWRDHYRHGLKERRERSIREVQTRDRELSQCRHYGYRW